MSSYPISDANGPELNAGIDREIDEAWPGLAHWYLSQSTGDGYPGRRNARARPAGEEAASAFQDTDRFQNYNTDQPTNMVRATPVVDGQLEVTGSVQEPARYQVKGADLDYSGLFTTDQLDPRMPESLQNLMNQPYRIGMGVTQDDAVSKMFEDLKVMDNPQTMNSQGENTVGAADSGKEAALRGIADARRRYGLCR